LAYQRILFVGKSEICCNNPPTYKFYNNMVSQSKNIIAQHDQDSFAHQKDQNT